MTLGPIGSPSKVVSYLGELSVISDVFTLGRRKSLNLPWTLISDWEGKGYVCRVPETRELRTWGKRGEKRKGLVFKSDGQVKKQKDHEKNPLNSRAC